MSDHVRDLWESRTLPDAITVELHAGEHPALVLAQGENTVRIEPVHAQHVTAALAEFLATGGRCHA